MEKIVGQPCPDCGTPMIQGKKGVYCKSCYIKWKNSQPKSATPVANQKFYDDQKQQKIDKAIADKKENIKWQVALKIAGNAWANGKIEYNEIYNKAFGIYKLEPQNNMPTGDESYNQPSITGNYDRNY